MSNSFNPFAAGQSPPVAPAPVQAQTYAPPAAVAAPSTGGGIDDPALFAGGFSDPLFPHVDGLFGLEVVGFVARPCTYSAGFSTDPSVHVTTLVHTSTNPLVPTGQKYRFQFKYDWAANRPVSGSVGPVHAKLLNQFIRAVNNRPDPQFSVKAAGDALQSTHFETDKRYVKLSAELRTVDVVDKATKTTSKQPRRRETWLPAA